MCINVGGTCIIGQVGRVVDGLVQAQSRITETNMKCGTYGDDAEGDVEGRGKRGRTRRENTWLCDRYCRLEKRSVCLTV